MAQSTNCVTGTEPSAATDLDLVRLAQRDQIVASFVAGRLRLWHGWPLDWDARALMRQVAQTAHDAIARAPIVRLHPTAAEHRRLQASTAPARAPL